MPGSSDRYAPSLRVSPLCLAVAMATLVPSVWAQSADDPAVTLQTVQVDGSQVELPPEYAGGQVATGGRVGLFGNLDVMETPFNSLNFTAELIRNQQARSVADVVQNDPAVRVARGFGNFQELYVVRGFPVFSDDMSYNGLYGLLPRQYVAAEFLERVEVFRGANSFINGAAPGGSGIGGAFNLVPKRAGEQDVRRLTLGTESGGQLYAAADGSSRFGADRAWGLRANAVRRDGDTAIDGESRELGVLALGVDHRGERARFSADLGYQDFRIDAPRPSVTPTGAIPRAPDAGSNVAQPWTYTSEEDVFGVLRGEVDLSDAVMAWAAAGVRYSEEDNVLANPRVASDGTLTASRFDNTREDRVSTGEIGIRAEFRTGAVGHRLSATAAGYQLRSRNAFGSGRATAVGTLYAPLAVAPLPLTSIGGDLDNPNTTSKVDTSSYAIADTLAFDDGRVLLTVGARQQNLRQSSYAYGTGVRGSHYDADAITPIGAVVFRVARAWSLYANYAEALLAGAVVPASSGGVVLDNAGEVLDPFRSRQVEVGAKYDNGNWGATAAVFRINQPNSVIVGNRMTTDGEQRNQGLELSAYGQPVDGLRVLGGLTVLDATLEQTQGGVNEGNTALGVPDVQANAGLEWDIPGIQGMSMDARVVYTDRQYANAANTLELPSWTRVDLGARYGFSMAGRQWSLRARVDNMFDRNYWASTGGASGGNYLVLGGPRSYTVSLSVDL